MVREGNFSDAARGVVRQFFQEQSGTDLSSTHGPPTVRSRGRPDLESRIDAWLNELWQIAYGPPVWVSASRFQHVLATLRALRRQLPGWQLYLKG